MILFGYRLKLSCFKVELFNTPLGYLRLIYAAISKKLLMMLYLLNSGWATHKIWI